MCNGRPLGLTCIVCNLSNKVKTSREWIVLDASLSLIQIGDCKQLSVTCHQKAIEFYSQNIHSESTAYYWFVDKVVVDDDKVEDDDDVEDENAGK